MGGSDDCSELVAVGVELDDSGSVLGKLEELDVIRSAPCSLNTGWINELEDCVSVDGVDDVGSMLSLLWDDVSSGWVDGLIIVSVLSDEQAVSATARISPPRALIW